MPFEDLRMFATNAALFLGVVIAAAAVYKLIDTYMKSRYDMKLLLKRIEKEMFPNHGTSLRDAVDRLEVAMASVIKEHLETRTRVDDLYLQIIEYNRTSHAAKRNGEVSPDQ